MPTPKYMPKHIVESGRFFVSAKKNLGLDAYLGTCVGVTLCDRQSGVGGLTHLLLPQPGNGTTAWRPAAYASTGLPLFLNSLEKAGAKKSRLEACIAGGALIGPLFERDLDLDIGGRTTEIVQQFLKRLSIPIISAETGGNFGCQLSLNLSTLDSSIHPISNLVNSKEQNFIKPSSEDIKAVLQKILPIPQIALRIIRMINAGNYQMKAVGREIKTEQVISAKVIRICNSTYFGVKKRIDSIDRALVILGEQLLLKMVISASMENYYDTPDQGYSLCRGGLFKHALETALVAEKLAQYTGLASADIAYTAGLLHDIGKVVLDNYLSATRPFFYRRTQIDGMELCKAEFEKLGITHTQAGRRLAESWSLPENLCDVIAHHHYPEVSSSDPDLTHIVYLADVLMSRFQVGNELECLNTHKLADRLGRLGLKPSHFSEIIDLIPQKIFNPAAEII